MPGITRGLLNTRSFSFRHTSVRNPSTTIPTPDAETNFGVHSKSEESVFNLRLQDFPPLPDIKIRRGRRNKSSRKNSQVGPEVEKETQARNTSCITFGNGRVLQLPEGIITDQHSITALLAFMRATELDPKLISIALGEELNPKSSENLYPCQPNIKNIQLSADTFQIDMVTPVNLDWYTDDFLFYLFYHDVDLMRMKAADELFCREWRYHLGSQVWISHVPGEYVTHKTPSSERGTYYIFDQHTWQNVTVQMDIEYSKLARRPILLP